MIEIRSATLADIPKMQALVAPEIESGVILERHDNEIANAIRSYRLAWDHNRLIGFGALHIHTATLAEIRSLVVTASHRGQGVGHQLVTAHLEEAARMGLTEVLVLAYRKELFLEFGFIEIPKEEVPDQKIWQDCIRCKHFPICNEFSLIKKL